MIFNLKFLMIVAVSAMACFSQKSNSSSDAPITKEEVATVNEQSTSDNPNVAIATLAGGCFWKMDACYQQMRGITKVEVGYAGGNLKNPTYEQVSSRKTGHAETVQVTYDPKIVSYREILEVFWHIHDPRFLNREGNDIGDDYRSAVFYRDEEQRKMAVIVKDSLDKVKLYDSPIVTAVEPYKNFYRAEEYHQNYYNLHPTEPYTYNVVRKKVEHFEKEFASKLKKTK